MKVRVLAVGGVKGPLEPSIRDYEERASRYWKLEVVEVASGAGGRDDPDAVREAEAERLLAKVGEGEELVALTREGKGTGSRALARLLGDAGLHARDVTFVIGGAWGLGPEVLRRARHRLSLSAMTLPHDVARLVLTEQLYRAGTILRKEPYHKGP